MIIKPSQPETADATTTETNPATKSNVSPKASQKFLEALNEPRRSKLAKLSKNDRRLDRSLDKIEKKLSAKSSAEKKQLEPEALSKKGTLSERLNDEGQHDAILDSADIAALAVKNQTRIDSDAPPEPIQSGPTPDVDRIAEEVANRILVSAPADMGHKEVRIQLKNSVLPSTEVRIFRDGGSLQVEFLTSVKDSQLFIAQRQDEIQTALGQRLDGESVNVSIQDSQLHQGKSVHATVQDSQQQTSQQGEHQGGRSRGQYIRPDEEDQ